MKSLALSLLALVAVANAALTTEQTACLQAEACTVKPTACFAQCFNVTVDQVSSITGCFEQCTSDTGASNCGQVCDEKARALLGVGVEEIMDTYTHTTPVGNNARNETSSGAGTVMTPSASASPLAASMAWSSNDSTVPVRIANPASLVAGDSIDVSAKDANVPGSLPEKPKSSPAATSKPLSPYKAPFVPGGHYPSLGSTLAAATPPEVKPSKPRFCRNIIIYGSCKFEHSGCRFSHEPESNTDNTVPKSPEKKNLRPNPSSPVFTPRKFKKPEIAEASPAASASMSPSVAVGLSPNTKPFYPGRGQNLASRFASVALDNQDHEQPTEDHIPDFDYEEPVPPTAPQLHGPLSNSFTHQRTPASPARLTQQLGQLPRYPLQYHLYSSPPTNTTNLLPHQKALADFFVSDTLRQDLMERNVARQDVQSTDPNLPAEVHQYHSLTRLEADRPGGLTAGLRTTVYKAISTHDGLTYALRRVEGFRLLNENAMAVVEAWRTVVHPNVVTLYEAFTTTAFGDQSLVLVYDYFPLAVTLRTFYFGDHLTMSGEPVHEREGGAPPRSDLLASPYGGSSGLVPGLGSSPHGVPLTGPIPNFCQRIDEPTLWSYTIQLASAVAAVHGRNLAFHSLAIEHILVTDKNRLHIDRASLLDFVTFDAPNNLVHLQREDLTCLGRILIQLACGHLHAPKYNKDALVFIQRYYSANFKQLILYLLGRMGPGRNVEDLLRIVGPRILDEINASRFRNDALQAELSQELENGRLVRLLCKFGFINERPEFAKDPEWSETGDRYLIKLFRDFVFHQVDELNRPVVDMAHVLTCLNKLDAGVPERIMLTSRDEQSCLIVSYRDIKECIETAYSELARGR
ncbi:PAB-dependent poly(A)-specific ribonuclease subunit 3 [Tieghemiomyces parasiticus]|uniref:PAN2-PAN3 deadenylation complex subunit PAN3 n=1 Tax=Tieghemiomyces parasiticus TaxID=78921 RepID=A0A9W8DP07_9FUNG|nr:PAB-dependent poly(A)-specific ribonuclease subunit 3 [Tieghemiomyces parasiticus]